MIDTNPEALDNNLVEAFIKAMKKTRKTLSKYKVNGVNPDRVPVNDRIGVWCTHLRNELFLIGDCSRQHAQITSRIVQTSQWDDVAKIKYTFERVRTRYNHYDDVIVRDKGVYAYAWLLQAHGEGGVWKMNNERLAMLIDKAKRSPNYLSSIETQTDDIKAGIKGVEQDLANMLELLQEHADLNLDAAKVVDDLCKVAEEMVA